MDLFFLSFPTWHVSNYNKNYAKYRGTPYLYYTLPLKKHILFLYTY